MKSAQDLLNQTAQKDTLDSLRAVFDTNSYTGDYTNPTGVIISEQEKLSEITIPAAWTKLEYLNLSENKELGQVTFAGTLPNLKHLDVSDSGLTGIHFQDGFEGLEKLDLARNGIKRISFQAAMPKLNFLELSGNNIEELSFPKGFEELKYLFCIDNQLKTLNFKSPPPKLELLQLRGNALKKLPENILAFKGLKELYLHGSSIEDIPETIIGSGEDHNSWDDIRAYLASLQEGKAAYLHEAKMILIGNGEVGKTSIRRKLIDEEASLPSKKERTPGLEVEVNTYTIEEINTSITKLEESINFDLNIWDFGGQGRYREAQQLFCTPKTIYLYVTAHDDTLDKEDYGGIEYWLPMVNAYSYDTHEGNKSPIIHIVNKIDEKTLPINEKDVCDVFDNIHKFVKISCKPLQNFDQLRKAIRTALPKLHRGIFNEQFSESWLKVKEELESIKTENHILLDDYNAICSKYDLDIEAAAAWLRTLDRIGTVIYFGHNEALKNWIILNPQWIKDALCNVLDSKRIREGIFDPRDFDDVWNEYTEEEHQKLIQLMLAYQLAYKQKGRRGDIYIVPSMLDKQPISLPQHLKEPQFKKFNIRFIYEPFIPAGTVSKLMVRLHQQIYNDIRWKNNALFHHPETNCYAYVKEDSKAKKVDIDFFCTNAQQLYSLLYHTLEGINTNLKNARFMQHLDFEVEAFNEGEWESIKTLQKYKVNRFSFLWERSLFEREEKTKNNMDNIKNLIASNRLKQALEELKQIATGNHENEITQLQSRLTGLERNERLGVISFSEANLEKNKITNSALSLIGEMENSIGKSKKNQSNSTRTTNDSTDSSAEIYVSYAWRGESEQIVDAIEISLKDKGLELSRDKNNVGYRQSIKAFMEDLGKSNKVIVVISEKYLKSANCMFELTEIYKNQDIRDRIYPIILSDANIYNPVHRIGYINYWDAKIKELDAAIRSVAIGANLTEIQQDLNLYTKIRASFDELAGILKDMNALTPDIHRDEDFDTLTSELS